MAGSVTLTYAGTCMNVIYLADRTVLLHACGGGFVIYLFEKHTRIVGQACRLFFPPSVASVDPVRFETCKVHMMPSFLPPKVPSSHLIEPC